MSGPRGAASGVNINIQQTAKSQTVSSALKSEVARSFCFLIISIYKAKLPTLVCGSVGEVCPVLRYKKFAEFRERVWKEQLRFKSFFYVRPKFNVFR